MSKRLAGSSVRPVSKGAETVGPASADEDMVPGAEELKSVPAPVLPSKEEVTALDHRRQDKNTLRNAENDSKT